MRDFLKGEKEREREVNEVLVNHIQLKGRGAREERKEKLGS